MTQQQADLCYWMTKRNKAPSFETWRMCQWQVDAVFRAMGYPQCPVAEAMDEALIFPQIQAQFEDQAVRLTEAA